MDGDIIKNHSGAKSSSSESGVKPASTDKDTSLFSKYSFSSTSDYDQPAISSPNPTGEKPKSKAKLVISLVALGVGVVSLLTGVIMFKNIRQSDSVVVFDAISGLIKSENTIMKGSYIITPTDVSLGIKALSIDFTSKNLLYPSSVDAVISLLLKDGATAKLDLSAITMEDSTLYVKIDGVEKALKDLPFPDESKIIISQLFSDISSKIDGQWYKFSFADLAKESKQLEDYNCLVSGLKALNRPDSRQAIVDIYRDHQFISVVNNKSEKISDYPTYEVRIDEEKAKSFIGDFGKSTNAAISGIIKCASSATEDSQDYGASEHESFAITPKVLFGIDFWSHELKAAKVFYSTSGYSLESNFTLEYPKELNFSAPENAKPFSDLMEIFQDIFYLTVVSGYKDTTSYQPYEYDGTDFDI